MTKWAAVLGAGIIVLLTLSGCGAPSPAAPILNKISGCTGIQTEPGNSPDDNTTAEGTCTLNNGPNLSLYMWPSWDTGDEQNYIYQTVDVTPGCTLQPSNGLVSGDQCIMGSTPGYLWFITLDISLSASDYAASWAPPIASALDGQLVTQVPESWCSTFCVPPSSPPPSSQSPSPSPSPSTTPPSPAPAPSVPAPHPGCYPLSNEGSCYEPGEYCRKADYGVSGIAGDGKAITCEYNDGYRWEPS